MITATWKNQIIAQAKPEDTINIEGNVYFSPEDITASLLRESDHHTTCPWKGEASYFDIVVEDEINENAAWYYPEPKEGSIPQVGKDFSNYVAFWNGVIVE